EIFKIIDIELKTLFERIEGLGYTIKLTEGAKKHIAEKGFDSTFGARPLRRAIQKYLEDPVAEEILIGELEGSTILIDFDADNSEMIVKSVKEGKGKNSKPTDVTPKSSKKDDKKEEK